MRIKPKIEKKPKPLLQKMLQKFRKSSELQLFTVLAAAILFAGLLIYSSTKGLDKPTPLNLTQSLAQQKLRKSVTVD